MLPPLPCGAQAGHQVLLQERLQTEDASVAIQSAASSRDALWQESQVVILWQNPLWLQVCSSCHSLL